MFSERLKNLRNERQLSQDDLCNQFNEKNGSGLNKSTISRYERGLQEPMLTTVSALATFFGVSPAYLIGDTNDRNIAAGVNNSAIVQGNHHVNTLIVKNGSMSTRELSDQAVELLKVFEKLDVRGQTALLSCAYDLELKTQKK